MAAQAGALRWDWVDIVPFHDAEAALGFAAFGEVSFADHEKLVRVPIRVTVFAVATPDGWRMRQFHGSIPASR